MNIDALIVTSLTSLGIPINAEPYKGTATAYIVFNYADERPVLRASGVDIYDETTVQVHYYALTNPATMKKSIRNLLRAGGFTIIDTQQFYETDTKYYHVIVTVWIEGLIND